MIDPIMKVEIEPDMMYELGKSTYCIRSLRDWFLVRRMFIDPMTNLTIKNGELNSLLNRLKEKDYFPDVDVSELACYRIFCIFEKYSNYKNLDLVNIERMDDIRSKIGEKMEKREKSAKRKNGENVVQKYDEQIEKLNIRLDKIREKRIFIRKRLDDNIDLLLKSRKVSLKSR